MKRLLIGFIFISIIILFALYLLALYLKGIENKVNKQIQSIEINQEKLIEAQELNK